MLLLWGRSSGVRGTWRRTQQWETRVSGKYLETVLLAAAAHTTQCRCTALCSSEPLPTLQVHRDMQQRCTRGRLLNHAPPASTFRAAIVIDFNACGREAKKKPHTISSVTPTQAICSRSCYHGRRLCFPGHRPEKTVRLRTANYSSPRTSTTRDRARDRERAGERRKDGERWSWKEPISTAHFHAHLSITLDHRSFPDSRISWTCAHNTRM